MFAISAKKWGENRVPDVVVNELFILRISSSDSQKIVCFMDI
jgi:hypothetical protein